MLHAIGDRGIDMALTAFERAARANGTTGRRHRVEHIEVPRTADLPRFKAAGVIASTQAMFPYPNRNHLDVYVPTLGPERARRALAFKAIDDAGAVQSFGSDWPVFTAEVVRGIACAVTRTTVEGTPAGGWEPSQRLTVEAALRHFTRDAAFAEHARDGEGHARARQARRLRRPLAGPPRRPARADQGHEGAPDRARRTGHLAREGVLMAVYAGKVVVVTGASQGIGKALCLELAAQRPRLVLAARDAAALEAVAAECRARGAETLVVPTDVGDEAACRALVETAVERFSAAWTCS